MSKFKVVSKYAEDLYPWYSFKENEKGETVNVGHAPVRETEHAACYDLKSAVDIVIPSFYDGMLKVMDNKILGMDLEDNPCKPVLVPTGVKVELEPDEACMVYSRSGMPIKTGLIVTNGVGIVDADYCDNPGNEGEIFVQFINLSPWPVEIKKGDRIAQAMIIKYIKTEDDTNFGVKRVGGHGSTGVSEKE